MFILGSSDAAYQVREARNQEKMPADWGAKEWRNVNSSITPKRAGAVPTIRLAPKLERIATTVRPSYSFKFLSRSALLITDTELKAIAAPAIMGLSKIPKNG